MVIVVTLSGGLAGFDKHELAHVDTTKLPVEAAHTLEGAVSSLDFTALPAKLGEAVGADMMRYNITVKNAHHSHTVSFLEGAPETERLRQLVDLVAQYK